MVLAATQGLVVKIIFSGVDGHGLTVIMVTICSMLLKQPPLIIAGLFIMALIKILEARAMATVLKAAAMG